MQGGDFFEIISKKAKVQEFNEEDKKRLENIVDTVKHITIAGNSYSKDFCQAFAQLLAKTKTLELLDLQNIFVGRLKDEIPESLGFMGDSLIAKNVIEIDLSDNAVNPFGAIAFSRYLSQATSLKKFLINNAGLGPEGTETIAQALEKGTPNLEVLAIARNRAEDKGATAVGKACGSMKNFKELHIYQDVVRKPGMIALLKNLQNCKTLEVLDIRDNFVKEEAAEEMAALLRAVPTLRGINMSDCNMEEEENDIIIEALIETKHDFQKLGYNYNELSSKQAKQLLDSILKDSTKLDRLDIKGNDFGKGTMQYYNDKLQEKGFRDALSKFESDDEDEDENIIDTFSELKI